MENLIADISLKSSDKFILIIAAIIIILLVLVIMYKMDNIPDDYKKKKKHNFESDDEPEDDEDLESQIENYEEPAEEKMEALFQEAMIEPEGLKPTTPVKEDISFGNDIEEENTFGNNEPEEISSEENYEYDEPEETTNVIESEDEDIDIYNYDNEEESETEEYDEETEEYEEELVSEEQPASNKKEIELNIFGDTEMFGNSNEPEEEIISEEIFETQMDEIEEEPAEEGFSMFTSDSFTDDEPVVEKKVTKKPAAKKTTTTKKTASKTTTAKKTTAKTTAKKPATKKTTTKKTTKKIKYKEGEKLNPNVKNILEWVYCILIAIILALLVRNFVGTPTIVKQESMYPTLKPNQRLILNRLPITFKSDLKRGDIITFEAPSVTRVNIEDADMSNPIAIYNQEPKGLFKKFLYYGLEWGKTTYIKRVIALPGEHLEIKDNKVYINGEEYKEPYLDSSVVTTSLDGAFTDLIVPEGCIFAMGDNRPKSTDCRAFGCVPIEKVEGKVAFRFWPLDTWGNPDKK